MAGLSTNAPGLWGGFAGLLYGSTSLSTPPGFLADAPPAWVPDGGVLAFEFDNGLGYNSRNLATTTPDSILTYTNPSPKLVYGSDGVLRYAPHNFLTYSEQFDNAAWTKSNSTITANVIAAPDGTMTADKVVETVDVASGHLVTRNYSVIAGVPYTQSVYIKAAERSFAFVLLSGAFTSTAISINLTTGVLATVVDSPLATSVSDAGNGWWRVSLTVAASSTGAGSITIYNGTGASWSNRQYNGDGVSGIYVWGAQLNLGATALTYIPTTTAAVYSLPIDHDPITFEPLGVLIEEQRVNLLLQSENCTVTWTNPIGPTTSTKVNIASPFHAGTAFQITSTLNSGFSSGGLRQGISVAATTKHILSFYVEDNVGEISILLENGSNTYGANFFASINTVTGTASGAKASQVTIAAVNGGWRVSADLGTSKAGGGSAQIEFQMVDLNVPKIIGAPQLEAGAFPTSYIPTTNNPLGVTRLADQVSILTSAFGWENATGTFYVDANVLTKSSGASGYFAACAGLGGNSNTHNLYRNANVSEELQIRSGNSTVAAISPAGATGSVKMAYAYAVDDYAISKNGGAVGTDPLGPVPVGVDRIQFGTVAGGNYANGTIKRLTYFPTRRTDADLQGLTRGDDLVWGIGDYLVWGSGNNLTW